MNWLEKLVLALAVTSPSKPGLPFFTRMALKSNCCKDDHPDTWIYVVGIFFPWTCRKRETLKWTKPKWRDCSPRSRPAWKKGWGIKPWCVRSILTIFYSLITTCTTAKLDPHGDNHHIDLFLAAEVKLYWFGSISDKSHTDLECKILLTKTSLKGTQTTPSVVTDRAEYSEGMYKAVESLSGGSENCL